MGATANGARGNARLLNAEERERLMGYGHGRTAASTAKGNKSKYEDERCSLVGDSLMVWSFVLFAKYTGTFDVALLFARMGRPPGCRLPHGRSGGGIRP